MLFGDAIWQHQVHVADVDAELQRGRGHQRLQLAGLQALLRVEPMLPREAAVVGRDGLLAEPLRQVPRGPLGEPARVDEDQRRAVLAHQFGEPVVDLRPHLVGHDGRERRRRQFDAPGPAAA